MRTFHTQLCVENVAHRSQGATLAEVRVDTARQYTWITESILEKLGIPREKKDLSFIMANGTTITRSVGFAILRVGTSFTVDEVVFAEKGDLLLLGARTLEGLNLTVDTRKKKLVVAGPFSAALSIR